MLRANDDPRRQKTGVRIFKRREERAKKTLGVLDQLVRGEEDQRCARYTAVGAPNRHLRTIVCLSGNAAMQVLAQWFVTIILHRDYRLSTANK